jgi:hypothetical protein
LILQKYCVKKTTPKEPFFKKLIVEHLKWLSPFSYHQKYLLQQHPWLLTALDVDPGKELIASHVSARLNGFIGGYGKIKDFEAEWEKMGLNEKMAEYVKSQMVKNKR